MTQQRLGTSSDLIWIPQSGPGALGAAAYVVPLSAQSGYGDSQPPINAPIFMGDGLPDGKVPGLITATGALPCGMEYDFIGFPLTSLYDGYNHVGTTLIHEFYPTGIPGMLPDLFALQGRFREASAVHHLSKDNRLGSMEFRGDFAGAASYTLQPTGTGDVSLADFGGTVVNYGYLASNYFNGQFLYDDTAVAGMTAFTCRATRAISRQEQFFGQGIAAGVNIGNLNFEGELGMPMNIGGTGPTADFNFYSDAKNQKLLTLDYLVADGPLNTCTGYFRTQLASVLVFRMAPKPGGSQGVVYNQQFAVVRSLPANMRLAGEVHATIRGPYNIGANNKLAPIINGTPTGIVTLATGATQSATDVVANLNADAGFNAVATADVFLGWPRVKSKMKGSTSTVAFDTGIANSAHALFGFDSTARAGVDVPVRHFLRSSSRTTNYT